MFTTETESVSKRVLVSCDTLADILGFRPCNRARTLNVR